MSISKFRYKRLANHDRKNECANIMATDGPVVTSHQNVLTHLTNDPYDPLTASLGLLQQRAVWSAHFTDPASSVCT